MKAITIYQPWATLIAIGIKKYETRSWYTRYRGPLAIHAAKKFPKWAKELCFAKSFYEALVNRSEEFLSLSRNGEATLNFPLGAVVAIVEVNHIYVIHDNGLSFSKYGGWAKPVLDLPSEPERSFGNYTPGRYAWLLEDVRALPHPVPAGGAQRLWDWEGSD